MWLTVVCVVTAAVTVFAPLEESEQNVKPVSLIIIMFWLIFFQLIRDLKKKRLGGGGWGGGLWDLTPKANEIMDVK